MTGMMDYMPSPMGDAIGKGGGKAPTISMLKDKSLLEENMRRAKFEFMNMGLPGSGKFGAGLLNSQTNDPINYLPGGGQGP